MTVTQSPSAWPLSSSVFISSGIAPTSYRSLATYWPPGFKPAAHGVFLKISAILLALVVGCSAPLVDAFGARPRECAACANPAVTRRLGNRLSMFVLASIREV